MGSIPGSGRCPGAGHGNILQYSRLENPMDRGAWQATVHNEHNQSNLACTQPSLRASQVVLVVKNLSANAGDLRDDMSQTGLKQLNMHTHNLA